MQNGWQKFIDTNILIYLEDNDNAIKHSIAINTIKEVAEASEGVISNQILAEFSNQMERTMRVNEINERIADYQNSFQILIYSVNEIKVANELFEDYKIHFFDALIAATMKNNNVNTIITENENEFKKIPWISVINPF